ncbi:MAG TPA: Panacea domain-containing protein, partial [Bacteroidales bacterium]|nr:Panacea domain-containing protein [Bacteroidales bacterium]
TKLNKLLFYSDFLCYKHTGFSISGAKYRAIAMGPVPMRYEGLYEYLSDNQVINIKNTVFSDEVVGEQFLSDANHPFNEELFSEQELDSLQQIARHFRNTTTKQIIELSHQEKGWKENQSVNNLIDYKYGFDLKAF